LTPDAAKDCLFRHPTIYECTMEPKLWFHNGSPLTSSDVKFSIERAIRLGQASGTDVLFRALSTIETPDPTTIRFRLKWADTQFAFALTTPVASIVDEASYDPQALRSDDLIPLGSGPYRLGTRSGADAMFTQYSGYRGATNGSIATIQFTTVSDSGQIEELMSHDEADVAWQGLDDLAVIRLQQQIDASGDGTTSNGWSRVPRPGLNVQRIVWNPTSPQFLDANTRNMVSLSLQPIRTLDSIVPRGVEGHVAAFPLGGVPTLPTQPTAKVSLRLGYGSGQPGAAQLAGSVKTRLESSGRVAVTLAPDDRRADLYLDGSLPFLDSALGWMITYLANPVPGSAQKLEQLDQRIRTTTDRTAQAVAISELQQQAAADNVVVPISQSDAALFLAPGVRMGDQGFASGWQFALWGLERQ
jgi:peptide/nickel transport system substrate-binding protein